MAPAAFRLQICHVDEQLPIAVVRLHVVGMPLIVRVLPGRVFLHRLQNPFPQTLLARHKSGFSVQLW